MDARIVYAPALAAYDLGEWHPLRPERFTLAVELMRDCGLVAEEPAEGVLGRVDPVPATEDELELVHDPAFISVVREAGAHPDRFPPARAGIGDGDTPAFRGMHDASALIAGATLTAMRGVLDGRWGSALSVAGGLHHAHRARAAGFCVYNDCAVAIADALRREPDLRVLYVDIDAHHGDGVQEAFWDEPRVLTISLHETGERLYPGTGFPGERGGPGAEGSAANVPLPEGATDACYALAFERVVEPLAERFRPDVVLAQCGADAHHADPLTSLGMTVQGYDALAGRIVALAGSLAGGRLVACGGGGYGWANVVPRCWTLLAARLAGREAPRALPARWRDLSRSTSGVEAPREMLDDVWQAPPGEAGLLAETERTCEEVVGWTRT